MFALVAPGVLLLAVGCARKTAPASISPSNQSTEQRWIIGTITTDLANLVDFAADSEHWAVLPPDAVEVREMAGDETGRGYALALRLPGGGDPLKNDLQLSGSAWSPELYVPMLRALFARLKLTPSISAHPDETLSDAGFLQVLTTPLTAQIEV